MAGHDYVTYDDVVSSDTCSMLSTPYTTSGFADFMTNKGGEKDMMGLYEVAVVNIKTNTQLGTETAIAKTEDGAKLKVIGLLDIFHEEPDELEFFVRCVGQWESKRPKEVKIVKEE